MILREPIWLLLAIPVLVSLWRMPAPVRGTQTLRLAAMVLLILALCGPLVSLRSRHGTVVIVADRSASMPSDADGRHQEIVQLIGRKMTARDRLRLVSFGEQASLEPLTQGGSFTGFTGTVNPDGSNLAEAIGTAVSLIEPRSPGRILVLTDGQWTGSDPTSAVATAVSRQIPIDYRLIERPGAMDLAIAEIAAPEAVNPNETFAIAVWVQSPVSQTIDYQLERGGRTIAQGQRSVPAGLSRLAFRDQAGSPGTLGYTVTVQGGGQDPVPENNTARLLVGVRGPKPLLCLSPHAESGLAGLLERSGLDVRVLTPGQMTYSLESLSNYQAMIIEDVPAGAIGSSGMETIAEWVTKTGAGLMMTGGKNAFGPGGYFKSPLEPIMPVSMELRQEHRKLSLAIVVALDRSGSMMAPAGLGKTKMDLANLATAEVVGMLSPMDQIGVLAVDSSAHLIVDMTPVTQPDALRSKILQIGSMGGGIYVYEALSHAARMIAAAEPQTKHIILFADAADAEEPGDYRRLLAECGAAGITVSVIGLGKPTDVDGPLLEEIAALGQGRCFFTESPHDLPRLFAQDTFVVARSSFVEDLTPISGLPSLRTVTGQPFDIPAAVGGYNLCYLRDGATLGVISGDEYAAPIVAAWQVGIGRTLSYTPQADGPFTGPIAEWPQVGQFLSSLALWTAGQQGVLDGEMALTQQIRDGVCTVTLHLDPSRRRQTLSAPPRISTLYGYSGAAPQVTNATMDWQDADTLAVEIPLQGARTYLSTVEVPGAGPVTLPPVTLPYSPEFAPLDRQRAVTFLAAAAGATGGRERIDVADIWADVPPRRQVVSLAPWLIGLAMGLFLLEVFQRRTGLLSSVKWDIAMARKLTTPLAAVRPRRARSAKQTAPSAPDAAPAAEQTPPTEQPQELIDALTRAQHKAQSRIKRQ